ncbi:DUF4232 domain-containing protein [Streptomyces sp. NPDC059467]|uniref:DUF4232 domain-containing protein n=1 Tax=Streptomyces sp. NPDC059467 TaxID=3346844 RepID=UPI003679EB2C
MNLMRHRSLLLATAGTALALSLAACQSDAPAKSASAASSSAAGKAADGGQADASGATDPTGPARSTASKSSADDTAGGGSAGSTGGQASATTRVCTAGDITVTAARQDGPPYTHIVLTAKNTSGHSCRLAGAPHIQFLESHKQDVPSVAKSKPAAPVVLTAGAPAYALVKLSDGGVHEDNEPVSAFSVVLEGDSTVIAVTAPGSGGIAVDPAKALTGYWTPELRNGADDF